MRFEERVIQARRVQRAARIFLYGQTGSGKTYSALKLAEGLTYDIIDPFILVFEIVENGRANLIADEEDIPNFSTITWDVSVDGIVTHEVYTEFFKELLSWKRKPDVLIVDNITYLWQYVMELYENKGAAKYTYIKPEINKTLRALFNLPMDWICTARARFNWAAMTNKYDPEFILEPQMEANFEYDVDFSISIDKASHTGVLSKDMPPSFDVKAFNNQVISEKHGQIIKNWLKKGISTDISNLVSMISILTKTLPEDLQELYTKEIILLPYEDLITCDSSKLELLVLKGKVLKAYSVVQSKPGIKFNKEVLLKDDIEEIKLLGKTYANANK